MYEHTGRSPIVIPVINNIGGKVGVKTTNGNGKIQQPKNFAAAEQKRFAEMRARLLGQDQKD